MALACSNARIYRVMSVAIDGVTVEVICRKVSVETGRSHSARTGELSVATLRILRAVTPSFPLSLFQCHRAGNALVEGF